MYFKMKANCKTEHKFKIPQQQYPNVFKIISLQDY